MNIIQWFHGVRYTTKEPELGDPRRRFFLTEKTTGQVWWVCKGQKPPAPSVVPAEVSGAQWRALWALYLGDNPYSARYVGVASLCALRDLGFVWVRPYHPWRLTKAGRAFVERNSV